MKHTKNRKNSNIRELKDSIAGNRTSSINKVLVNNQIAKCKEIDKQISQNIKKEVKKMEDKLKLELISLDKKRLNIRNKYKEKLINTRKLISNKDYIFFPKSMISEKNYQLRYGLSWLQNGFILKKGNNVIAVDPGVNFVLRLTESGFDLSTITHIFISHSHLDHSADANVLMDFLIRAKKSVKIIGPKSVYEEKVISDFHSGQKNKFKVNHSSVIIDENSEVELLDGYKMRFIPLQHSVECYGFKISSSDNSENYTYLSDTSYTKELLIKNKECMLITNVNNYIENAVSNSGYNYIKEFAKGSNVLIANIDSFIYTKNSKTHLPIMDLLEIVRESNIQKIILAHINPIGELKYKDWGLKLAKYVYKISGIQTVAIKESGNKFWS